MKKIYLIALFLSTQLTIAQTTISFEAEEGYSLGTLHNQNGWEVTESSDGFVQNQTVSTDFASQGIYAFKNAEEPDYDWQYFPIFGAVKTFDTPMSHENFTMSYDVLATATNGADFEFTLYTIDDDEIYVPIAGVGLGFQGDIYVISDEYYGTTYTDATWTPNTWTNVRIEVDTTDIKYYINDTLVITIDNYTQMDVLGFNMLHNNFGNDAYYDNFIYSSEALGLTNPETSELALVYPNPVPDQLTVQLSEQSTVANLKVYSLLGQLVSEVENSNLLDTSNLTAGHYILKIRTEDGRTLHKQIVKE